MSVAASPVARIAALAGHERRTRFAGGALGPLWAHLTPLAWIAFMVVLFRLLDRSAPLDAGPEIFVATGVLPYLIFRQTVASMARAGIASRHMRLIRPTGLSDILLATAIVELRNAALTATLIFGLVTLLFGARLPADPLGVFAGLGLAWILAVGLGRLVGVIGLMSDTFARLVPILLRPVFWLSGIFYAATELSARLLGVLWFSPTLHVTELLREGYFLGYRSPVADWAWPVSVAALLWLSAAPFERHLIRARAARYRL
ncbi:MAG: ABC transporter permease [Pseudomonadota bacterium]